MRSSECPKPLAKVLERVNAFGPNVARFEDALGKLEQEFSRETRFENIGHLQGLPPALEKKYFKVDKSYFDRLAKFAPHLAPLLFPDSFSSSLEVLRTWLNERYILVNLIQASQQEREYGTHPGYFMLPAVRVVVCPDGSVEFLELDLLNILAREKNILPRLRVCPICTVIYWAKRLDGRRSESKTCGEKRCSNNYHQRKRRAMGLHEDLSAAEHQFRSAKRSLGMDHPLTTKHLRAVRTLNEKLGRFYEKYGDI